MFSEKDHISLLWIALIAAVIVFMVTASLYESFKKPFVIILSIPFSLVGLFLAYYLTDTPFGRGGYAAIILLIGIVVTNSIVLVDYVSKKLLQEGVSQNVLLIASSERLRPILMTTLTTIGGLLPMLFLGERTSIWYSLALGTIGGLSSSMVLTLVVIPTLLSILYRMNMTTRRVVDRTQGRAGFAKKRLVPKGFLRNNDRQNSFWQPAIGNRKLKLIVFPSNSLIFSAANRPSVG